MVKFCKIVTISLLLLAGISVRSQNLTGHWYGIGILQTTGEYNGYLSEMILHHKGKTVNGKFLYYFRDSLVTVTIKGNFNENNNQFTIQPFPVIYYLSPSAKNSIDCMLSGSFQLVTSQVSSVLAGRLFPDNDHRYTVPDLSYRLTRSDDTLAMVMNDTTEPIIKDSLPKPLITVKPSIITNVAPQEVQTIEAFTARPKTFTRELAINNSSLRLEIYDNGEIDYDSVSLFLNNQLILPKTMLTHRAIRLTIQLDPTLPFNELSMFAENLGRIPPNTAALIVHDGEQKYEILLTSDLSKSATLKLVRKQ